MPTSNRKHLKDLDASLVKRIHWVKDIRDLTNLFGGGKVKGKTAVVAAAREKAKAASSRGPDSELDF